MSDITEKKIGRKIVCGMCGKEAESGCHITMKYKREDRVAQDSNPQPGCSTLSPALALLGLSRHRMEEVGEDFDTFLATQDFGELGFMHWFVNDCCRTRFTKDCSDLGFKIDREKLSLFSGRSLKRHGLPPLTGIKLALLESANPARR
tara:strand:+ start:185 stop:628 length:444 start_codon:yes stop_codon:yes gene_type:complete